MGLVSKDLQHKAAWALVSVLMAGLACCYFMQDRIAARSSARDAAAKLSLWSCLREQRYTLLEHAEDHHGVILPSGLESKSPACADVVVSFVPAVVGRSMADIEPSADLLIARSKATKQILAIRMDGTFHVR